MTDHPREKPVAVITGASRRHPARRLPASSLARVPPWRSRHARRSPSATAEELRQLGCAPWRPPMCSNSGKLCRLAAASLERFGHVDVLLHNAGVSCPGRWCLASPMKTCV